MVDVGVPEPPGPLLRPRTRGDVRVGRRRRRAAREIRTPSALVRLLASSATLRDVRIQDLDLTPVADALLARDDVEGLVVLGGTVPPRVLAHLRRHGGIVFPPAQDIPVDVYRPRLYLPKDLYAGLDQGYAATCDARAYAWATTAVLDADVYTTLLRAIHDDSVTDALDEVLEGRDVVGVMGGHALTRADEAYAATARLGHALSATGRVVLTGGGPGAMEAANLGAYASTPEALEEAVVTLRAVPRFRPDVTAWAELGLRVRADLDGRRDGRRRARSIGVPTWFYGHEPPNVFCDGIAKYFSNALREDGLLARCTTGIVVMPGAAGTVQEVFQAVTPLFYATADQPLPRLVLLGREHWTRTVPVWEAVRLLARGRPMEEAIHLVDDPDEAVQALSA
ncbi:conserved hypothetical protein [Nostocoides japonicum T1-X7]|uniref:Rossmann fold nucleotide-binding protein n=1 Tax=Nostocoides japonicum T1-X7 TaxID=1194083 RepID=A0A077M2A0_9MICO|nr:LOG family protein [Tetrasphaera japonica]CCH80468.1 conserved hypothetical protein [Tetrasphaera japonica T1-X7]